MDASAIIQVVILLVTVVTAFSLNRFKTNQHDKDISSLKESINTNFKRLDATIDRVTVLEQNTKEHMDLRQVEEKFVTRKELNLHLEKIELTSKHTADNVEKMTGKLEDLMQLLSSNVVKTLSGQIHD